MWVAYWPIEWFYSADEQRLARFQVEWQRPDGTQGSEEAAKDARSYEAFAALQIGTYEVWVTAVANDGSSPASSDKVAVEITAQPEPPEPPQMVECAEIRLTLGTTTTAQCLPKQEGS